MSEELAIAETAQRRVALESGVREAAEIEKERIREAHRFLESERSKFREEQEALRAEMLAAAVVYEELAAAHRKEIVTTDFRSGELAVGRVQDASLEKERDQVLTANILYLI